MMAHFYGTVEGGKGEATRCGTTNTGMRTVCASYTGSVRCWAYVKDGVDWVQVALDTGKSPCRILYDGPISGKDGA